jgi:TPR repeat protein
MKPYILLGAICTFLISCSSGDSTLQPAGDARLPAEDAAALPPVQSEASKVQSDDVKSRRDLEKLIKLAELGDTNAMVQLAWKYRKGEGVQKSDELAVKWYQKAAEKGDSSAQDNLGVMYRDGTGMPKMPMEAAKWFELSAKQGNAQGQGNLGHLYIQGIGVKQDLVLAYAWSAIAVKNGNSDFAKGNMEQVKKLLKPEQLSKAESMVAQWKPGQSLGGP